MKTKDQVVAEQKAAAVAEQRSAEVRIADRMKAVQKMMSARESALTAFTGNPARTKQVVSLVLARCSREPELLNCETMSLYLLAQKVCALGLSAVPEHRHFAVQPRWNKHLRKTEAVLVIEYRGLVHMARASGQVKRIDVRPVFEGEDFHYDPGTGEFRHPFSFTVDRDPSKLLGCWALAEVEGLEKPVIEVMTKADIDKRRAKAETDRIWKEWPIEMACKTVLRRLLNTGKVPLGTQFEDLGAEGEIVFGDEEIEAASESKVSVEEVDADLVASVEAQLAELEIPMGRFVARCCDRYGMSKLESISHLTAAQLADTKTWLDIMATGADVEELECPEECRA